MTTAVKAIFEHGVFRPMAPVHLKESTEVEVLVPIDAAE
jgi:predicted DNA-binding antitoxin AbrB/MazE fold protein